MGLIQPWNCDTPFVPDTCDGLWAQGDAILTAALAGLDPFIPEDDCDTLEAYTTHGVPTAPLIEGNDRLSVSLVGYGATQAEQNKALTGSNPGAFLVFDVNWRVELWLQGYPMLGGDREPRMPTTAELTNISRQLDAIGGGLYGAVLAARTDDTVLAACTSSVVTPLLPLGPSAGLAGWGFNVTTRS